MCRQGCKFACPRNRDNLAVAAPAIATAIAAAAAAASAAAVGYV